MKRGDFYYDLENSNGIFIFVENTVIIDSAEYVCPIFYNFINTLIGGLFMEAFDFIKNKGMIMFMISKLVINMIGRIVKGLGSGHCKFG